MSKEILFLIIFPQKSGTLSHKMFPYLYIQKAKRILYKKYGAEKGKRNGIKSLKGKYF